MPYTTEDIIEPYWAEYSNEASGRDPLAIQNSSVVIYAKMIVGITNVTNRIRYNGFYCWIFEKILKNSPVKNSEKEQIRYSRRAELLLAYIMVNQYPDVTGVSGTAYAARNVQSNINLKKGADWESKKEGVTLYWKYKSGIFGQYYSSVVRELNLINHPQGDLNIYTLTEKGIELAEAFDKNIPTNESKLFLNCVFNGSVNEIDLAKMKSFALHIIPENSDENSFYKQMLLLNDDRKLNPTYHRKNTIKLILQYLQNEEDGVEYLSTSFLRHNYSENILLPKLKNDTSSAWYLFEINEIAHVVFEHFHACFLYSLETYPLPLDESINSLIEEISLEFKTEKTNTKTKTIQQLFIEIQKEEDGVYDYYFAMQKSFKEENFGACILNAIKTLLSLYNDCKEHIQQLEKFASLQENNFNRIGNSIDLFKDLIESKWELTISSYSSAIILLAINTHTFSSYSKTKIGQSLVHNYMIEDNSVWRLRETEPNRTSPRLQNVAQYMIDVGWLKKEEKIIKITDVGIQILTK
jgi:hypothetical protein